MAPFQRTALITGASSGIGVELAKVFARHGHDLVIVARSGVKLADVAAMLEREHGVRVMVLVKDLDDASSPRDIYNTLANASVQVDFLVNNAGFASSGLFAEGDVENEMSIIEVNVQALAHLTRLFLPGMIARGSGRIMNVGSMAGFMPGPYMAVYYASKAFVLHFSEALAEEVRGSSVTVTALCPGPVPTGFGKRAGVKKTHRARNFVLMEASDVARIGYDGMMAGKTIVIAGQKNKLIPPIIRMLPRSVVRRLVHIANGRRHK